MKRFYYNMTTEPIKYRTWLLLKEDITEADFLWLKAFDIPISIDPGEQEFNTSKGVYRYAGKQTYTLESTTDKQRNMIVLKYGNIAMLIQEEIVLPGTMSTCTLDRIVW